MPSVNKNWECPYCCVAQVISNERYHHDTSKILVDGCIEGKVGYEIESIVCANDKCKKLSVNFRLLKRGKDGSYNSFEIIGTIERYRLLPKSFSKSYPDYIPEALRNDYEEACAIRDLSPKASATLIRRCIQGIIRDFCKIQLSDNRLISEIKELQRLVDEGKAPLGVHPDTIDAIDAVRKIGNIGAHMEADINVIVEVDPGEAQTLIELAEMLFDEWYIQRQRRSENISKVKAISAAKKELQNI